MNIRKEENKDYKSVFNLIENAFKDEIYTDHKEQFLVERLRKSESFVPELSLIAEIDGEIVGYILLIKIKIINNDLQKTALALAPIAVLKKYQGKGIGGKLILEAHQRAKELGFDSVILLGHEKYYPKFGYKMTKNYGIKLPFEVPDENCMLIELTENALKDVTGTVAYPKEFYE
ncbi:GCN5-related N-acetyltransferase [Flavobacterium daejeonense]|nr:GCN5-related N-acetyltransferase [Flavobacterium daejeonense]